MGGECAPKLRFMASLADAFKLWIIVVNKEAPRKSVAKEARYYVVNECSNFYHAQ